MRPTYKGELMLAGWRETHNSGAVVSFWLPDSADLEVFRGLTVRKGDTAGQRFMAVLVEIGDDEQPKEGTGEGASVTTPAVGPLCQLAVIWCKDSGFQTWIMCENEAEAAQMLRARCEIESRKELDSIPLAARRFQERIRAPFMQWLNSRRSDEAEGMESAVDHR